MTPDYDIHFTGPTTLQLPVDKHGNVTMDIISIDHGVVHAKLKSNGMKVAIVQCGQCSTLMMRRLCIGGSRLEDIHSAGVSHVLEHADFRIVDWNKFGGMDKNASTSKLFIEHQTHLLLDPSTRHLETELLFQAETMQGKNLHMADEQLLYEVQNVADEGLFNAQKGSSFRSMIMEVERLLLPRVWESGWVQPTIGLKAGQEIPIKSADDLIRFHRKFRSPSRNTLVLAGPVDTTKTLQLVSDIFSGIPTNSSVLPIPKSVQPRTSGLASGTVSTNSGSRGIALGFLVPPYGDSSCVINVLPHITNLLGQSPELTKSGVVDVMMYINQGTEASVGCVVAKLSTDNHIEQQAMLNAQKAIEQHILVPLMTFDDDKILAEVVRQLDSSIEEALASGPQQAAALAVQGILAADTPSLAWRHADINSRVTCEQLRNVVLSMFNPDQMAIVRATSYDNSVSSATRLLGSSIYAAGRPALSNRYLRSLHISHKSYVMPTTYSVTHLPPHNNRLFGNQVSYQSRLPKIVSLSLGNNAIATYNTSLVQPRTRKQLIAQFGDTRRYGGWASASIAVAALNAIAKCTQASACKFELCDGIVTGKVQCSAASPNTGYHYTVPLVRTLAVATALIQNAPSMARLRALLPEQALLQAIEVATKDYDDVTFQVQALTRSKLCGPEDSGYIPPSLNEAMSQLTARCNGAVAFLQLVSSYPVRLAGTNTTASSLQQVGAALHEISKSSASVDLSMLPALHTPVSVNASAVVDGLRTYPFVAALPANIKLSSKTDRAALIVSKQVMAGGMGSVYTYDLRQHGVSYRPSGALHLSWQDNPVLTLSATFDDRDKKDGTNRTQMFMQKWAAGDATIFTATNIRTATKHLREKVRLRGHELDSIGYSALAALDPDKLSTSELMYQLQQIDSNDTSVSRTLRKYFSPDQVVVDSIVHAT